MNRYSRNISSISEEENKRLRMSRACVVGCGGLGGHVIEMLARLGLGSITAIDGDVFEETNLNRQILANELTIGKNKARIAKQRIEIVNSGVNLTPIEDYIDRYNARQYLEGHHVVIDALDDIASRFILQDMCFKLGIPLVHGAIGGWYGQVCTIFPGENSLDKIYKRDMGKGAEKQLGNLAFTAALVSSVQVSEVVKILIDRGDLLQNKLLCIDSLSHDYNILEISSK